MKKQISIFSAGMLAIISASFGATGAFWLMRPAVLEGAVPYPDSYSRSRVELVKFKGDDYYSFVDGSGQPLVIRAAYGSIPELITEGSPYD